MKLLKKHFEQARQVALLWRQDGYDYVVVVRHQSRARVCLPSRQQDLPSHAVGSWDYYPIPTIERLGESDPTEETASRAELWIAATIAYGCYYDLSARAA